MSLGIHSQIERSYINNPPVHPYPDKLNQDISINNNNGSLANSVYVLKAENTVVNKLAKFAIKIIPKLSPSISACIAMISIRLIRFFNGERSFINEILKASNKKEEPRHSITTAEDYKLAEDCEYEERLLKDGLLKALYES